MGYLFGGLFEGLHVYHRPPTSMEKSSRSGALAPAILKNRLLAPAIFGHCGTVGKIVGAK